MNNHLITLLMVLLVGGFNTYANATSYGLKVTFLFDFDHLNGFSNAYAAREALSDALHNSGSTKSSNGVFEYAYCDCSIRSVRSSLLPEDWRPDEGIWPSDMVDRVQFVRSKTNLAGNTRDTIVVWLTTNHILRHYLSPFGHFYTIRTYGMAPRSPVALENGLDDKEDYLDHINSKPVVMITGTPDWPVSGLIGHHSGATPIERWSIDIRRGYQSLETRQGYRIGRGYSNESPLDYYTASSHAFTQFAVNSRGELDRNYLNLFSNKDFFVHSSNGNRYRLGAGSGTRYWDYETESNVYRHIVNSAKAQQGADGGGK